MPLLVLTCCLSVLAAAAVAQEYPAFRALPAPEPAPQVPSLEYAPPLSDAGPADAAPVIYSHSDDAGPDQTAYLAGSGLTDQVFIWGPKRQGAAGGPIPAMTHLSRDDSLFVVPNQDQADGVYLLWAGTDGRWSAPVRLNAPQPWWCGPDGVRAGETARVFGRNLARRPDNARAFVYLARAGEPGVWAEIVTPGKYAVEFRVPLGAERGEYQVWVHAGTGGRYGWGGPVKLTVLPPEPGQLPTLAPEGRTRAAIQQVIDSFGEQGGNVALEAGVYELDGTLVLPAGVTVRGRGMGETLLQLSSAPGLKLARARGGGWNQAPSGVHTPGDTLFYEIDVPEAGEYVVWLRYGCDNSPWGIAAMDGHCELQIEGQSPVAMKNLPNSGSFAVSAWSRTATLTFAQGKQRLLWRNTKGGGISLDAFVFTTDPDWDPGDAASIEPAPERIVLQAEDVVDMQTREARLPGESAAVVLIRGDGAVLQDLTILGSEQSTLGVLIRSPEHPEYLHGARIERVRIADIAGKHGENCGVLIEHAEHVTIQDCDISARAPVFLRGLVQGRIAGNRLNSVTRTGGNAEAALLARNDVLRETIVEDNVLTSPYPAGGPTQRRMIWVSTGEGSVDHNYFARNRSEGQQFGGVAGTDQNVGEMILFEANMRMAYYGPATAADETSVTVSDAAFLPPLAADGTGEPVAGEYYVTVCKGPGLGQTRRVVAREESRFLLDRPWRETPTPESRIVVTTLFYRNIVHANETRNGMTGIQLWIGCVENVVADNVIARQRKPGIFLFSCATLAEPVMPRTWNRGIGVFYYNHVEGNRIEETTDGILLTDSTYDSLPPIDWPRCLGTVLRHNSCVRSRSHGVNIRGRHTSAGADADERSILGTVCEFNVVRDQPVAYLANDLTRATVFRRNHAYFWHTWTPDTNPVAYHVVGAADTFFDANSTEGIHGTGDRRIIETLTEAQP